MPKLLAHLHHFGITVLSKLLDKLCRIGTAVRGPCQSLVLRFRSFRLRLRGSRLRLSYRSLPLVAALGIPLLQSAPLPDPEQSAEVPLPMAELSCDADRHAFGKKCAAQAAVYHGKGEYTLSYRLYARCVANGWIDGSDFYRVMRNDAEALARTYHEKHMTVLVNDGSKDPAQWPVARLDPALKTALWKDKGIPPKHDWLSIKDMVTMASANREPLKTVRERPALTLEECRRTLARYDLLRDHVQNLIDVTEDWLVVRCPGDQTLESLRANLIGLKKDIRLWRTRFVSYSLASPFLAETVRLRCIAKDNFFQMLFYHRANAGKRLDAVSMLALACHKEILMSCTEEVRIQFCDTVSGLKRISKSAEWEHFTILTTMLDSYDPGKKRGADAWWE